MGNPLGWDGSKWVTPKFRGKSGNWYKRTYVPPIPGVPILSDGCESIDAGKWKASHLLVESPLYADGNTLRAQTESTLSGMQVRISRGAVIKPRIYKPQRRAFLRAGVQFINVRPATQGTVNDLVLTVSAEQNYGQGNLAEKVISVPGGPGNGTPYSIGWTMVDTASFYVKDYYDDPENGIKVDVHGIAFCTFTGVLDWDLYVDYVQLIDYDTGGLFVDDGFPDELQAPKVWDGVAWH